MEEEVKLFYCYSYNLKKYFKDNGLKYLNTNVNCKNGKRYFIYIGNDKLNELLRQWRDRRNKE